MTKIACGVVAVLSLFALAALLAISRDNSERVFVLCGAMTAGVFVFADIVRRSLI